MDCLDYESDSNSIEDVILEDSECEYDSDTQYDKVDDQPYTKMSDLEFIAAHAVDIPVYSLAAIPKSNVCASSTAKIDKTEGIDAESSDDDDESDNDEVPMDEAESSSSSSDSDEDVLESKGTKFKSFLTEEEEESVSAGPPKTKNELLESVLYPTNVSKLTSDEELIKVGEVLYRIDHECVVVVQAYFTTSPLNESSMLCNEAGVVLGRIHEVFGPITTPYYIVRWESASQKNENKRNNRNNGNNKRKGATVTTDEPTAVETVASEECLTSEPVVIVEGSQAAPEVSAAAPAQMVDTLQMVGELFVPGTVVYAAKSRSLFVTPGVLLQQHGKGSDASNAHDEEPPEEELEYSDDEKELAAKQERNRAKRALKSGSSSSSSGSGVVGSAYTGGGVTSVNRGKRSAVPAATAAAPVAYAQHAEPFVSPPYVIMPPPPPYAQYPPYPGQPQPQPQPQQQQYYYPVQPNMWPGYTNAAMYQPPIPTGMYHPPPPAAPYPGSSVPLTQQPLQYTYTPLQPHQQQQFPLNSSLFTVSNSNASNSQSGPKPPGN